MIPVHVAPDDLLLSYEAQDLVREHWAIAHSVEAPEGATWTLVGCAEALLDLASDDLPHTRTWSAAARERWAVLSVDGLAEEARELVARLKVAMAELPDPPLGTRPSKQERDHWRERVRPLQAACTWVSALCAAIDHHRRLLAWSRGERADDLDIGKSLLGTPERKRFDRLVGWIYRQGHRRSRRKYDAEPARAARRHERLREQRKDPAFRAAENKRARERYAARKQEAAHVD